MIPVRSVPRDPLAPQVTQGPTARTESLAPWELAGTVALRVCAVSLDPLALRASRVRRVRKAALVLVDSRASKDLRVTLATVDPRAPAVVVRLGHRDLRASKDLRVSVESQVPVLVGPLAPWDPRVSVERWGSKVPRVTPVHLVRKVSVVAMASRVIRELQAPWDALACVALRVTAVCRAPRVTLVSRAPRVTREMSAFVAPLVLEASLAPLVLRALLASVVLSVPWAVVV